MLPLVLLDGEFASLLLSPLTSDLALRRWQNGALLDCELLLCAFQSH